MAILKKQNRVGKLQVDISGPQGNAFAIMGLARSLAKQIGTDPSPIINDMMSGDYENLLRVFDNNFGEVCDLLR